MDVDDLPEGIQRWDFMCTTKLVLTTSLFTLCNVGVAYHIKVSSGTVNLGGRHKDDGAQHSMSVTRNSHAPGSVREEGREANAPYESLIAQLRRLPFNVLIRLAATVLTIVHNSLEITGGLYVLPALFYLLSDDLQLISGFLVRIFLFNRGLSFITSASQRKRVLKIGTVVLVVLLAKSAVIMNAMAEMGPTDIDYPVFFLYMTMIENTIFDVGMTAFTAFSVLAIARGMNVRERKVQGTAIKLLLWVTIFNLASVIVVGALGMTIMTEYDSPLVVVINGTLFACSIWFPEAYFMFNWYHSTSQAPSIGSVPEKANDSSTKRTATSSRKPSSTPTAG